MPTQDSANPLVAKCLPRIVQDIDRCSGATVCNVGQTTIDELDTLYKKAGDWRVDHVLQEADFRGKACGAKQNGFYDLINATRRQGSRQRLGSRVNKQGQKTYEPFIRMGRTQPINNHFWRATYVSGPSSSNYTYDIESATDIPHDIDWFPAGMRIHLFGINKEDGTRVGIQAKVVSASISGGKIRAVVTSAMAGSVAPAGTKAWPGTGDIHTKAVVLRGTANVSDYEEYCPILPGLNSEQEAYFWVEWTRWAMCDSELQNEYIRLLIEGNPLYKKYYHVPDVAYNRQVQEDWQARMVNQFLFGKASSANQTATDWPSLPTITLDSEGQSMPWNGACVGRKADAIGIFDQLHECERIWDLQRQALSLPTLFEKLYEIKRIRESNGIECTHIELGMDSHFALQFQTAMIRYFNMRGEGLLRLNLNLGAAAKQGNWGFYYTDYVLDFPMGLTLRVVTHPFWDDLVDAHRSAYQDVATNDFNMSSIGAMIWIIDWSTCYQEAIESNKVVNKTGSLSELAAVNSGFACRMKVVQQSYTLNSLAYANIVECPKANLIILNYDRCTVPTHTGSGCGNVFMPAFDPEPA